MASGGYRAPANPAPVSGPGALSRRTDGGQPVREPGGLPYGENQELRTQMQAAPMSGGRQVSAPSGGGLADLISVPTAPIGAESMYPDEPLTAGVDMGPGAGSEVRASAGAASGPTRVKLMAQLPMMMRMAEQPDASPEFRSLVRYLRSQV